MPPKLFPTVRSSNLSCFITGATACLIGSVAASRYFLDNFTMAACALMALFLQPLCAELLEKNRKQIWEEAKSAWVANHELAGELAAIFLGIFCVATVRQLFWEGATVIGQLGLYRNSLSALLQHNMSVLLSGFVLAFVFRAGGLMLVLSWNALHWCMSLVTVAFSASWGGHFLGGVLAVLSILPHLVLEASAYILAGMSGFFLIKALLKYSFMSDAVARVSRACVVILVVSIVGLLVAGAFEVYIAQPAISALRASTGSAT